MASKKQREQEEAESYAWSIRENINRDWHAYNAVLIDEFGIAGLKRIKLAAWKILDSKATPR